MRGSPRGNCATREIPKAQSEICANDCNKTHTASRERDSKIAAHCRNMVTEMCVLEGPSVTHVDIGAAPPLTSPPPML